jgi:hypothetical protein
MRCGQTWSGVVAPGQAGELMLGSRTGTADLSSVRDPRRDYLSYTAFRDT